PQQITSKNAYEVNINDSRANPSYGTGGIPNVAKASPMLKAADKWNTYEIVAQGPHLVVTLNGTKTVDVQDSSHSQGPIALQYNGGTVKVRRVQIRPLATPVPPRAATAEPDDAERIADLVIANHIIADQGVVDGFGHISVRSARNPAHYFIS